MEQTRGAAQTYAGFWVRVGATFIDTVLMVIIIGPILYAIYGPEYFNSDETIHGVADFVLNVVAPAIAVVLFWIYRSATPGKMAMRLKVVDARTGQPLTAGQAIGRYLGYYVSIIPVFLGLIWVAFDDKKQGFHDKLAGTVVIREG